MLIGVEEQGERKKLEKKQRMEVFLSRRRPLKTDFSAATGWFFAVMSVRQRAMYSVECVPVDSFIQCSILITTANLVKGS